MIIRSPCAALRSSSTNPPPLASTTDIVVTAGQAVAKKPRTKTTAKMSPLSREQKTLAEKNRRNKLNECFRKLLCLVPMVALAEKRIDKSSVLRLAGSFLRFHKGHVNELAKSSGWRPGSADGQEWEKLLLASTGGFAILVTETGHMVYVSEEIKTVLGHAMVDVLGRSIYSLVHPDDCEAFVSNVKGMQQVSDPSDARCEFFCSMLVRSSGDGQTCAQYYPVHVTGHLKIINAAGNGCPSGAHKVFTFVIKPCVMTIPIEGIVFERRLGTYFMRMSLRGHFIFTDHWFSMLLGYLPSELIGISGVDFLFHGDILLGLLAHRHLLFNNKMIVIPLRFVTGANSLVFVIAAARIDHKIKDYGGEDTVFVNVKTVSAKEGERAQAAIKRRLAIVDSDMNGSPISSSSSSSSSISSSSDFSVFEGECANSTSGSPPRRPRGRPRKHPPPPLPPGSTNGRSVSDGYVEVINWVQNFKANNDSVTDLRSACKEFLERDAEAYSRGSTSAPTMDTPNVVPEEPESDDFDDADFLMDNNDFHLSFGDLLGEEYEDEEEDGDGHLNMDMNDAEHASTSSPLKRKSATEMDSLNVAKYCKAS